MSVSPAMTDAASAAPRQPVTFVCSTCGSEKEFLHASWRARGSAETFCSRCRGVKTFRNPQADAFGVVPPAHLGPTPSASPIGYASAAPSVVPPGSASPAIPPGADPAELWPDLVARLAQRGTKPEDLAGAEAETLREAFRSLGYDPLTAAKLQNELQQRHPLKPAAAPATAAAPTAAPAAAPPADPPAAAPPTAPSPARADTKEYGSTTTGLGGDMVERETQVLPPPVVVDGTTSVDSALDEDDTTRRTTKLMEAELMRMDQELRDVRDKLAKAEAEKAAAGAASLAAPTDEPGSPIPEPPEPAIPYPELTERIPTKLWPVLKERLSACGFTEEDISWCSPAALDEVLRQLAFTPLERARLTQEFQAKFGVGDTVAPKPAQPDPPKPVQPALGMGDPPPVEHEATPLNFTGPPTAATLTAAEVGTNLQGEPDMIDPSRLHRWPHWSGPGWPSENTANPPSDSALDEHGWMALPKCPVHPDKEVEFWDPITETLVSAHAHLSGIHKDHPFVPMHEAARRELPGLADWVTRAGGLNAKLLDHDAALSEVHQTIDSTHQQQIDSIVLTVDQLKKQLDDHRDQLIKRIQGHAAAQHELFRPTEDRLKDVRHIIAQQLGTLDTHLGANPDAMTPEDLKRWSVGIMAVREKLGNTFAAGTLHPVTVSNWTQLRFNVDATDDMLGKLYLTKTPATVPLPSLIDLRDLSHPMYTTRDRINFKFAEPEPPADDTQSSVQLRNDHKTATYVGSGSGHVLVRGSATFEAGRHYWEIRIDSAHNDNRLGTHVIVGLVAEGSNSMGATTGMAWRVDTVNGMVPMAVDSPPWTPGSLLGVFLDLEMDRVGLYHNKQCVAHIAIPHGRYTPAASISTADDQVTLIPLADIPHGVSLTSGLASNREAFLVAARPGVAAALTGGGGYVHTPAVAAPPEDDAAQRLIEQLQLERLRLETLIKDQRRDLAEQHRRESERKFQAQQVSDLKRQVGESVGLFAKQQMEFEVTSEENMKKLQEHRMKQLEEERKKTWHMQVETAQRAKEAQSAAGRQQDQQRRLDRLIQEQQVLITEHVLEKQRKAAPPHPHAPLPPGASVAGAPLTAYPPGVTGGAPAGPRLPPPSRLGHSPQREVSPNRAARWGAADVDPHRLVSPHPAAPGQTTQWPDSGSVGSAARLREFADQLKRLG
eukprot:TRINITY_DN21183_c0_g1_i1.p1 TRINITY_DN21183_c0_g1~~TRINITY_DN21183_c0_g1_i1.p1  ORF type:complete len:1171 (+),score=354.91 TRINITY_DN21183_c0_g1_i1:47-3559(+)